MTDVEQEIAAAAARWVVEEGLEYGPAKRRAARELGLGPRTRLPDNQLVEDSVREYLALFAADTQPGELRALRQLAWPLTVAFVLLDVVVGVTIRFSTTSKLWLDEALSVSIARLPLGDITATVPSVG